MVIIKADDYRCFMCGEILQDLFKLQLATMIIEKADLNHKVEKTVQRVFSKGGWIYRHKKRCQKGEHGNE